MPVVTYLNRIGTALPSHDVHQRFIDWASKRARDRREQVLFRRMVSRVGIAHRWSVLPPELLDPHPQGEGFFEGEALPTTRRRMAIYAHEAPDLAHAAVRQLGELDRITHIVVASCTGFVAPGIDQMLARRLGLRDDVERTLIGFMGCYAAVTALRTAHHIVRSQSTARVLVVTVELCTLHLQAENTVDALLAMLLFGDGAAAAIVSAEPVGLEIGTPFAIALPDSDDLITWTVGDTGFSMQLSGKVPARIGHALADEDIRNRLLGAVPIDSWAVHAGGRSILDSIERALGLDGALAPSRQVLHACGNMSSSTLMFVLAAIMEKRRPIANGCALAFGPGLAAEGFRYRSPQ